MAERPSSRAAAWVARPRTSPEKAESARLCAHDREAGGLGDQAGVEASVSPPAPQTGPRPPSSSDRATALEHDLAAVGIDAKPAIGLHRRRPPRPSCPRRRVLAVFPASDLPATRTREPQSSEPGPTISTVARSGTAAVRRAGRASPHVEAQQLVLAQPPRSGGGGGRAAPPGRAARSQSRGASASAIPPRHSSTARRPRSRSALRHRRRPRRERGARKLW